MTDKTKLPTTAVSTIAVQSGNTRIVTALLQSKNTFQLKIHELQPCMTEVGSCLEEASSLLKQHKDVMEKIRKQQSPVEELLRQVDGAVVTQKSKAVVYDCMADNLSQAWKNVNEQLQKRLKLLELAVSYYSKAKEFTEQLNKIQADLTDDNLPNDSNMCHIQLQHLQYIRKGVLESSLHTLNAGHILLEALHQVGEDNLGDARPNHIYPAVQQATSIIEKHMELLHDQKYRIDIFWNKRKLILEQCLEIFTVSNELEEIHNSLIEKIQASKHNNELGDSVISVEKLQKKHNQIESEIKDIQNRAIHLLHKLEKAAISSNPLCENMKTKAYCMLSECTEFFAHLENRNLLLCVSLSFFTVAQQVIRKVEKLESQLRILSNESMNSSLVQKYAHIQQEIEDIVNPALQEGHSLLEKVDKYDKGSQGVVRKMKELENLYHQIKNMIPDFNALEGITDFYNKCNSIESWLNNIGDSFLKTHTDMGNNFMTATVFVDLHKQFHDDVKLKSKDIEALIDSCSAVMKTNRKAINEIQKKDELHQHWRKLCNRIEKRIYLSELYVSFHHNYKEIYENIANIEKLFKQARDKASISEDIEKKRISLESHINSTKHSGTMFIEAAYKLEDPYLDIKSAILCVERLLKNLKNHYDDMITVWTTWKSQLAEKDRQIWEQFCRDVEITTENVHRLEGNLFPILSRDMDQIGVVVEYLKRCSDDTSPKIKQIQSEVEAFFKRPDFMSSTSTLKEEEAVMKSQLQGVYTKLQKDVASYQILVAHMNALFHNLKELDNLIEKLQSEYRTTVLSQDVTQAEIQLQKLDTTRTSVTELFKKVEEEAKELINKITELEPYDAARKDQEKILYFIKLCKDHFTLLIEEQKKKMKDNLQMCHFNAEFKDINHEIDDVQKQLKSIENSFRDSLEAAKQALWTFRDLQKGVEHLDQKIRIFMGTFKYNKSDNIQREIEALRKKWTTIQTEISKLHHLINIAIECFQLIEEAKDWFREGSQLLVTIARKSSLCKTTNDAEKLLKDVEDFLTVGKTKQEERFYKISILVLQLFEGKSPTIVQQLTIRSKDMIESLEVIKKELYSLIENLKAAEEEQAKEKIIKDIKAEASRQFQSEFSTTIHKPIEISEKHVTTIHASSPKLLRKEIVESPKLQRRTVTGKPPIFTVPLNDSQIQEGSKFVFYCQIEAGHNPIVRWFKNDILIYNNPEYATSLENNICTLTIEETLPEDSAVYTCKVENEYGKAESSARLHVKESRPRIEPPHFIKELEPGKVKEKESFRFACQVTGNPLPLVSWYKKDICIDSSPDFVIIFNNGYCQLHIKEAHLEDEGCYSCRATNKAGQAECSATLNVISLFPIEAPSFPIPLSNVTVRNGHNLHLECLIRGYPIPSLSWSHNGIILKENSNLRLRMDQNKATLEKPIVVNKDAGTYTITAKNLAGEAISSSYVTVKEKLTFEASDSEIEFVKPIIKEPLHDQHVYENSQIQLDCVIVGNPEPEVIWYHNGKPVKESDKLKLLFEGDRCTLILKEISVNDAGNYRCVAINPVGEASSECKIIIKSLDSPNHQRIFKEYRILEEKTVSPKFVQLLEDTILSKGKTIKLHCKIIGEPELLISWYKDGEKLYNSSKYKIDNDLGTGFLTLTIYDVDQNDEGKYVVQASNKYGEAKCYCSIVCTSPKVSLKPVVPEIPPKFLILLRNTNVIKGQEAKFDCLISGTPKPNITWYYEDKPLKRSENYIITEDGHRHSLVVLNTTDRDNGRYSVTAENNSGKATSSAHLTVESPLKTVWNGVEERKTSQKTLLSQSNFTNRTLHQESNMYELHQTSVGYHEDIQKTSYNVSKINHTAVSASENAMVSFGLSSRRIPPTVSVKPSKSLPPKFIKPVECSVVEVGEDIILQGQIEGYPEPTVAWSLGEKEIFPRTGLSISFSDNVASLKISKATERDSGRYTCTASNSAGVASSTADVIVRPHRNPPKFVHPLQPCIFKSGDRVQLDVEVMGTPLPKVKWYHNGNFITDSLSFYTTSEGTKHSLVIPNATSDHSGKLTVKAINTGGEAQCTVDLIFVDNASLVGKAVSYREMSVVQQTEKVTVTSEK